ncbi:MAG: endonuclease/exonuclease/phosphatase family protein [Advenella sp.]|uniref:Endonuclease n=1 Tax=Advenella kashmirensis TaxID=310575 RepID=A0A356LM90_9BURK|nr:endonuclease/exonuclease/phosphatase family protein [Advenella sp. FME57]HBP31701.1 endonuclease [Advenella kashmirensis]
MTTLKVVSYNIHKGKSAFGKRVSLADLQSGLTQLSADLVFLQEVQGRNSRFESLHAQQDMLANHLSMDVCYGCNAVRTDTDHGNALLSRFRIVEHENEDISDHRLEQRGVLHARVEVDGKTVHCFVAHLGLFAASRGRQAVAIIERIKRLVPDHEPLILAGDFNDWNEKLAPYFDHELGLHEVFANSPLRIDNELPRLKTSLRSMMDGRGLMAVDQLAPPRTFPAMFPWLRLDRMYQRGFTILSAQVLKGLPWARISDHAPILAELELA